MGPENSQILAKSGKIEPKSQNDQKILKNPSQGQYVGSRHPKYMILTYSQIKDNQEISKTLRRIMAIIWCRKYKFSTKIDQKQPKIGEKRAQEQFERS